MKIQTIIICLCCISINPIFGQDAGELYLQENRLQGKCENKFFSGFEIELDTIYNSIDSTTLFAQFPRIGKVNFKNRIDIPTEFTITNRAGFSQIMFRFKNTYLTFDDLIINEQFISFTIDNDPEVPVTKNDLAIVRLARKLLSEEKFWNKDDDRNCDDDLANKSYSLYCALRIASMQVEDKYNHRNAVLQKLRHLIAEKYPNKKWKHRLMDYNNMEEVKYTDIIDILDEIETEFEQEIEESKY